MTDPSAAIRATAEAATARVLAEQPASDAGWTAVAEQLEALVRDLAGVTGAFELVVYWDGQRAAPVAIHVAWEPPADPGPADPDPGDADANGERAHWLRLNAGPADEARDDPRVVVFVDWSLRDSAGEPVGAPWPEVDLPTAAARILRAVASSHRGHQPLLRPVVAVEASVAGGAGVAHLEVAGNRIGSSTGHAFDFEVPPATELVLSASLQSTGAVSVFSLMGEVVRAATGR